MSKRRIELEDDHLTIVWSTDVKGKYSIDLINIAPLVRIPLDKVPEFLKEVKELYHEIHKGDELVCPQCGSTNVETDGWVDANTLAYAGTGPVDINWCDDCQVRLKSLMLKSEYDRINSNEKGAESPE